MADPDDPNAFVAQVNFIFCCGFYVKIQFRQVQFGGFLTSRFAPPVLTSDWIGLDLSNVCTLFSLGWENVALLCFGVDTFSQNIRENILDLNE